MTNQLFTAADIGNATGGEITADDLRNWIRADLFNTKMRDPAAGKPREYPLLAVYEAVLLSKFSRGGIPLVRAKKWNKLLVPRIPTEVATIDKSGGQYGNNTLQIIVFHRDLMEPVILSDSAAGETFNRIFYEARPRGYIGPLESISALHMPQIITRVNNALGVNK